MAIYHLHAKVISRAAGRNAVNAAAYRHGARMTDTRTGEAFDYRAKSGIAHTELTVPADAPAWAQALAARQEKDPAGASAHLWNRVEAHEKRKDAQLSREIEIALPAELTLAENIALTRAFVSDQLASRGLAADWSIHSGKNENIHAHVMVTMSRVTEDGFAPKSVPVIDPKTGEAKRKKDGRILYQFGNEWGGPADIEALRAQWADYANTALARAGHGVRVDHRSYKAQGIDVTPTVHIGTHAQHMHERGKASDRVDEFEDARAKGAREIEERPERVFDLITSKKAVFTRHDMAREINRYIDDPARFQRIMDRLAASPELRELVPEPHGAAPAKGRGVVTYSTRAMIAAERAMVKDAKRMASSESHALDPEQAQAAFARYPGLSEEQRHAGLHITGKGQLKAVAGRAGTGKTTLLKAVREAYEAQGFRVYGAALAGKAAEGLQEGSGIESRTLASLEYSWGRGMSQLSRKAVLVIDEAGMIGSRQLGRVLAQAEKDGAKVVLVGDAAQLQPIEAGAPFRAIIERTGFAEITAIRRQREDWARKASHDFATGNTESGIEAYRQRGHVRFMESREAAKSAIARDWMAERKPGASAIVFAHTNEDVSGLNAAIRSARRAAGELQGEAPFKTGRGIRQFAAGDRVLFRRNDRELGVTNGTLGTVEAAGQGRLSVRLDGGELRQVNDAAYADVDHGYAVTLHKGQGVTVDRAYMLASGGMDSHMTYVGMTRHRDVAKLYAGKDDFRDAEHMGWRLSRKRFKETTLDFAERRGIDTWRDWLDNGRALLDAVAERLERARKHLRIDLSKQKREQMLAILRHGREADAAKKAIGQIMAGAQAPGTEQKPQQPALSAQQSAASKAGQKDESFPFPLPSFGDSSGKGWINEAIEAKRRKEGGGLEDLEPGEAEKARTAAVYAEERRIRAEADARVTALRDRERKIDSRLYEHREAQPPEPAWYMPGSKNRFEKWQKDEESLTKASMEAARERIQAESYLRGPGAEAQARDIVGRRDPGLWDKAGAEEAERTQINEGRRAERDRFANKTERERQQSQSRGRGGRG